MNIVTKKEETLRLEDLIKNEEESLKAREIDIKKDEKLVKKFVESVQEAAEQAIKDTENELKIKEEKTLKHNQLQNEEEKLKNQREKLVEELDQLKKYKEFLLELGKQRMSLKKEKDKKEIKPVNKEKEKTLFLTEQQNKENEVQPDQNNSQIPEIKEEEYEENENPFTETKQVLDLLEIIEEKNLQLIQNQSETKADLEKLKNQKKDLMQLLTIKRADWEEKKSIVDKQKEVALKRYRALTNEFNQFEKNKFQINEQKEIDMDSLSEIILSLARDIELAKEQAEQNANKKKQTGAMTLSMMKTTDQVKNFKQKQTVNPTELYNCFKMIEDQFRKAEIALNKQQKLYESNKKTKAEKIERDKRNYNILEQYKQEKRAKENQLREQKEKEEQQKKLQKKLQAQQRAQHFGRKPMTKKIIKTEKKEHSTVLSNHDDSDDKYFNESFDLGNSSPEKSTKNNTQHQQANSVQILKNI